MEPGSAAGEVTAEELRRRHHVTGTGDPDGRPVLFTHGHATDQGVRRHVAPAFEALGDRLADVECVPVPTLVMQTSDDALVPLEASRHLERRLPDGHLVLLPATGRFPSLSAPPEVIAAIRAFL